MALFLNFLRVDSCNTRNLSKCEKFILLLRLCPFYLKKSRLRLSLSLLFDKVIAPKELNRYISELVLGENGDVEIGLSYICELSNIMELIRQASNKQLD